MKTLVLPVAVKSTPSKVLSDLKGNKRIYSAFGREDQRQNICLLKFPPVGWLMLATPESGRLRGLPPFLSHRGLCGETLYQDTTQQNL